VVKLWIGPTRQELAFIARAARKQGVPVSQFIREELDSSRQRLSAKLPPRSAQEPSSISNTSKLARKRKG